MTFKLRKPTNSIKPETQGLERILIVRRVKDVHENKWARRNSADKPLTIALSLQLTFPESHLPGRGDKGTAIYLTPEEAEDIATALQFYARNLDV